MTIDNQEEIKNKFLKDIRNHSMEVKKDDGIYRHLTFSNNGSNIYRFDIITWPGYLTICGDMGSYVFSRIPDMFEFFRSGLREDGLTINAGYWQEKLQAVNSNCGQEGNVTEFDQKIFEDHINDEYNMFLEDNKLSEKEKEDLYSDLEDYILNSSNDGEVRAYDAVSNFKWSSEDETVVFTIDDFWERNCHQYTYHYIWILYAIVWGIKEYDTVKHGDVSIVREKEVD